MGIFDSVKSFFGLNTPRNDANQIKTHSPQRRFFGENNEGHHHPGQNFSMYSDPLQIHQYFEQQMHELMKNFGFQEFGNSDPFFGFHDDSVHSDHLGGDEVPHFGGFFGQEPPQHGELRDYFLKPGYEKPNGQRIDKEIDGTEFKSGELDSIFRKEHPQNRGQQIIPYEKPRSSFFGQSFSSRTVRKPDGSVEIHKTVRDSQGNEETTVTKKMGDKEYSVITKKDKNGQKEIVENLINMDENELNQIFSQPQPQIESPHRPHNWFPYDNFFK